MIKRNCKECKKPLEGRKDQIFCSPYCKSSFVRKDVLLSSGFNPRFITHYWKGENGNTYLFVYEYGFMEKIDNGKHKYILVKWQPYMENQLNLTYLS